MSKPSPPTPPNPIDTARAATGTNVSTAVANAFLNNVNQNTPTGSLNYNQSGNYGWTDPTTGATYNIPTFTATQTLSPQEQAIQQQTQASQYNLASMANNQSARIGNLLSNEMDLSGAPAAGQASSITSIPQAATSFDAGGPIQSQLNLTGAADPSNIQTNYGAGDFSADRQNVQDALMARLNPQLDLQTKRLQQQLSDQGIRYGSDAYNNAFTPLNQQQNDARFAAISQAGQEQQRMMDEAAQRAGFQNAAQQQAYTQAQGAGTFANTAQGQQFQQNAALGAFGNAGLAQQVQQAQTGFNAADAARAAYMQEQYAQRNQPINEITSLLSGSQVSQPNFVTTPQNQIPTTDIAGLMNQNFQNQMGIYGQQNQQYNTLVGGVLGLGAGAMKMSDERSKENIKQIGTVFATDVDHDEKKMATVFSGNDGRSELPIYTYSYKQDPASVRHIGPMAQDVEKIDKQAVKTIGGIKHIDTARVMGNILRAA